MIALTWLLCVGLLIFALVFALASDFIEWGRKPETDGAKAETSEGLSGTAVRRRRHHASAL